MPINQQMDNMQISLIIKEVHKNMYQQMLLFFSLNSDNLFQHYIQLVLHVRMKILFFMMFYIHSISLLLSIIQVLFRLFMMLIFVFAGVV